MKKRIAILSLVAIFISVTSVSAQVATKKEAPKTETQCDKKSDAKCCDKKADAKAETKDCCKTKTTAEKACCSKDTAKTKK